MLLAIMAVAFFMRFYQINLAPPGLYPDEAMNGSNTLEALSTGNFKVFYPENNGREGMFINIQALSVKTFGNEPWALRIVSAIFGLLTVLGLYFLTKEIFPQYRWVPLLAAFFLATSFWHVNFSRIGFRAISAPFFLTWGMLGLLRGLRTGNIAALALGGIAFGAGFNTYISYRLAPLILIPPLLFYLRAWWKEKSNPERKCAPCAILLFGFFALLAILPLGIYYLKNPADFLGRASDVSILATESPIKTLILSGIKTLGMFNISGDCNWRHNLPCQPELLLPVGILFLIGLGILLKDFILKIKSLPLTSTTLLGWFGTSLLPGVLSGEGIPHALRTILALPVVMIMAALGLNYLIEKISLWHQRVLATPEYFKYKTQLIRIGKELNILLFLFLLLIPMATFKTYFFSWARNQNTQEAFSSSFVSIGRYLRDAPRNIPKYIVVNQGGTLVKGIPMPAQTTMFISDTYLEEKRGQKNVYYIKPSDLPMIQNSPRAIIIPLHFNAEIARQIKNIFPTAKAQSAGDFWIIRTNAAQSHFGEVMPR